VINNPPNVVFDPSSAVGRVGIRSGSFAELVTADFRVGGSVCPPYLKATGPLRGAAGLGLDGVHCTRVPSFNYLRRRAEHLPVECSPLRRARRLRARVLSSTTATDARPLSNRLVLSAANSRLHVVDCWGEAGRHSPVTFPRQSSLAVILRGSCPWGYCCLASFGAEGRRSPGRGSIGGLEKRLADNTARTLGLPVIPARRALKGSVPPSPSSATMCSQSSRHPPPGPPRCSAMRGRPLPALSRRARENGRRRVRLLLPRVPRVSARSRHRHLARHFRASRASYVRGVRSSPRARVARSSPSPSGLSRRPVDRPSPALEGSPRG